MANEKRLIYAEDAEKALFELRKGFRRTDEKCAVGACILEIREVATVDVVEVVHGRWVQTTEPLGVFDVMCGECSNCHESFIVDEEDSFDDFAMWKYCPNCGAKMDGDGNG